jgi:hypothetical protein
MRLDRTTVKQLLSLLLALVVVLALVYVLLPERSRFKRDYPDETATAPLPAPETRRLDNIDDTPTNWAGVRCPSTGLAAVDLAGNCRATPQATMGALEAVDK